jgi:hypothetical protein
LFPSSYRSKLLVSENKKARCEAPGFFLADKRFEISNRELIKDIERLVKLSELISEQSVSVSPGI